MSYFLTTARLGFRTWREDDLPLALGLYTDPRVAPMLGTPATPEAAQSRLAREIAQFAATGLQYWPFFLLESGEFAGCAGLRPHELSSTHPFHEEWTASGPARSMQAPMQVFEIGYHLHPDFWGRGLATEAGSAVIAYAFQHAGADALFAGHHPANDVSRRVLLKLGFDYIRDDLYPPTGWTEPTYLLRRR